MKKNLILFCAMQIFCMSSCVLDESIESLEIPQIQNVQSVEDTSYSRTAYNAMIYNGGNFSFAMYDENNPTLLEELDESCCVYAYNGEGATWHVDNGVPSLLYSQKKQASQNDCFGYYYGNGNDVEFKDAFAYLNVAVINKEPNLHLTVNGMTIKRISRKGTFVMDENEPHWKDLENSTSLTIETDSIGIAYGDTLWLGKEYPYPIIPQTLSPWDKTKSPVWDEGSYILLDCMIHQLLGDREIFNPEKDVPLWCSSSNSFKEVAIPVSAEFQIGKTTTLTLTLENGCAWMNIHSGNPSPILVPINFSPTVGDWE